MIASDSQQHDKVERHLSIEIVFKMFRDNCTQEVFFIVRAFFRCHMEWSFYSRDHFTFRKDQLLRHTALFKRSAATGTHLLHASIDNARLSSRVKEYWRTCEACKYQQCKNLFTIRSLVTISFSPIFAIPWLR